MESERMPRFNTVVLDAGHGGVDSGGRGNGISEKQFTLALVAELEPILRDRGFRVVLTRNDDRYLRLSHRVSIGEQAGNSIFISIHANMGPRHSRGFVAYKSSDRRTESLARRIQAAVRKVEGTAGAGVLHNDFWVLVQNRRPALLLECGFMTNGGDAALLRNAAYRHNLADAIAGAIGGERASL